MGAVCPVLGNGRGRELGPVFSVHLAVEGAAVTVAAATQTARSGLVALVKGVVALGGGLSLRSTSAAIFSVLALAALAALAVAYRPAVGPGLGAFLFRGGEEAAGDGFEQLVRELVGAVVERFKGQDRHVGEGCKGWLRKGADC